MNYLEIIEILTDKEAITKLPSILRIRVTDRADAREKLATNSKLFQGISILKNHHIHNHGLESSSCKIEDLNKTDEELDQTTPGIGQSEP